MSPSPKITMRFMAAPTDRLLAGSQGIGGGRVLEWIDKAAYACAAQWSGTYCVTAYVGHIHFTRPIPSGHIVEVRSRIAMTGRTSMHIVNEVLSADPREGVFTRACDCLVIFVAKSADTEKPTPIPTFSPANDEEHRVLQAAQSRINLRAAIKKEMDRQNFDGPSDAPRMITRFLAKPTDVNWGGKTHGGTAMEWIDEAGTACTTEWAGINTVATYAGGIRFTRPISIGDLVEVDARLMRTDRRGMQVVVRVRSGDPKGGRDNLQEAIHATLSYIGMDEDWNPMPARQFEPQTKADIALAEHALNLRQLRKEYAPLSLFSLPKAQHID